MGDYFVFTAKDDDGVSMPTLAIAVRRNKVPTKRGSGDIFAATITGTAVVVGTQRMAFTLDTDNNKETTSTDTCTALNTECFTAEQLMGAFELDGDPGATYSVRSASPANVSAEITDGKLVITGVSPLKEFGDVKVYLKVTDGGKLESEEHIILVDVDPEPTVGSGLISSRTLKATNTGTPIVNAIAGFFTSKDEEDDVETMAGLQLVADDGTASTDAYTNNFFTATISDMNLSVTPRNEGTGQITILAEEGGDAPVQWVKHTISITVTPNTQ